MRLIAYEHTILIAVSVYIKHLTKNYLYCSSLPNPSFLTRSESPFRRIINLYPFCWSVNFSYPFNVQKKLFWRNFDKWIIYWAQQKLANGIYTGWVISPRPHQRARLVSWKLTDKWCDPIVQYNNIKQNWQNP